MWNRYFIQEIPFLPKWCTKKRARWCISGWRLCTVHPHKAALTSSLSQSDVNWKILHSRAVIQRNQLFHMIEKKFIKKNTVWQFDKFYHDNLLGLFFPDWKMIQGAKQAKKTRDLFSKKKPLQPNGQIRDWKKLISKGDLNCFLLIN